jgi:hypothetical protein
MGAGKVEHADGAATLAHRHTQPGTDTDGQRWPAELRPTSLDAKVAAHHWLIAPERGDRRALALPDLGAFQGASGPPHSQHRAQLPNCVQQQEPHSTGTATARHGRVEDLLQNNLKAELGCV